MRRSRSKKLSSRPQKGLALILIGLFFLIAAVSVRIYQESQEKFFPSFKASDFGGKAEEGDLPTKILIPKVRIDLPVFLGKVLDENWEIATKGASYLQGSGVPGRVGNVVIYGHNKKNQFGPILWLKEGSEIKIINKKGGEFIYEVKEIKRVSPQNIEVLSPTQDSTLTLYTCTGFLDQERFIVTAKLVNLPTQTPSFPTP